MLSVPLKLLLALVLGAVIGLERETYEEHINKGKYIPGGLGIRTFSLITLLGATAGLLFENYFSLFVTINIAFMALMLAYYILGSIQTKDNGITTEVAIIFSYLLGVFISIEFLPVQLIVAITVVLILILSYKERVHRFVAGIRRTELNAFISFAIIALVILPFLPNISYQLSQIPGLDRILSSYGLSLGQIGAIEIVNPQKLWLIVALITGVDIFGYGLEKTIGQRGGWVLTSMAGGLISSTATTQSLAQQSKKSPSINLLVAAAIFSNMASFFQIFVLIAFLNGALLVKSTPLILAIVLSSLIAAVIFLKSTKATTKESLEATKKTLQEDKIFSLGPALRFALLFLTIRVVSKLALVIFGSSGFLATSALAAITGLDAVIINLSELAGNTIGFKTAVWTLILVNGVNLLGKVVYSFAQGKKEFAYKFALSMGVVIAASFLGLTGL